MSKQATQSDHNEASGPGEIKSVPALSTSEQSFSFRGCKVIISKDAGLWHMSVSRKDRLPTYEELKAARYQFMPDVQYAVQIFPPTEDFVNVHEFCLHLWEPKDFVYSELNIESFLSQAGGTDLLLKAQDAGVTVNSKAQSSAQGKE